MDEKPKWKTDFQYRKEVEDERFGRLAEDILEQAWQLSDGEISSARFLDFVKTNCSEKLRELHRADTPEVKQLKNELKKMTMSRNSYKTHFEKCKESK